MWSLKETVAWINEINTRLVTSQLDKLTIGRQEDKLNNIQGSKNVARLDQYWTRILVVSYISIIGEKI